MSGIMKVQANCLQVGDIMSGTGERVAGVQIGLRTPKGKCEVMLTRADGSARLAIWGKYTVVGIKRQAVA
jgi:hypothetical protein